MRCIPLFLAVLLWWSVAFAALANELTVLNYHDILPESEEDSYGVSRSRFVAQMDYLKQNGYNLISLAFLDKVQAGEAKLPYKALMLTFDDGLLSYYEFAAPLLKMYGFPSVVAIVTGWIDGQNLPPEYKGKLMNWVQIKELSQSKLVEIASHTHNLHHGILSNPQGNEKAAAITRQYFPFTKTYETEEEYRQRIQLDLRRSAERFTQELGKAPNTVAWPYGDYNQVLVEESLKVGYKFQLTLQDGPTPKEQLPVINRIILVQNPDLRVFVDELNYKHHFNFTRRFTEISLDPFIGVDMEKQDKILGKLLDRLQKLNVNMVLISPFTEDYKHSFFPTKNMPVATDMLNRAIHQIRTRLRINHIYLKLPAQMPVKNVLKLYADMSRHNTFKGIVIDGVIDEQQARNIKKVVAYYQMNMEVGAMGMPRNAAPYDFIIYPINANTTRTRIRNLVTELSEFTKPVYFSLKRDSQVNDKSLISALQALRSFGVKHFGYGVDDYVNDLPNEDIISNEFTALLLKKLGG